MTSGTDPPYFICCEFFNDNLQQFKKSENDSLHDIVSAFLNSMFPQMPFVLSPLHTESGGKPHLHGILDIQFEDNKDFEYYENVFKAYNLPRPEICRNIYAAELYLTHNTVKARLENKQTFSSAEIETMVYANGYKMHKLTARDSDLERAKTLQYISNRLFDYICSNNSFNLVSLVQLVRSPGFYSELDVNLSLDSCISRGINEVKTHYRFYLQYSKDYKKQSAVDDYDGFCDDFKMFIDNAIHFYIQSRDSKMLMALHFGCYANMKEYKKCFYENSSTHTLPANNLQIALKAFETNKELLRKMYDIFAEIIEKR